MSIEGRRYLILDAALSVFAADGPKGATIDQIAASAGLARAQIYEVFPSKEGLFEAALERESQRITDHMRLAGRRAFELPLVERTRALYRSIIRLRGAVPREPPAAAPGGIRSRLR